nr:hypothetical protein [Rhodococcus jostii]
MIAADEKWSLDGKLVALADLAGGNMPDLDAGAVTVFKSVGTALQDLVAAKMVYDCSSHLYSLDADEPPLSAKVE